MSSQIAVIGIGCRYPGSITSPESMWELIDAEVDAISSFPSNRHWNLDDLFDPNPDAPGKTYVTNGGFIHDAHLFDNEFFGINPREAMGMDPQHRVLLQVTWEALERAAILPKNLKGTRTGVYVGIMANEYGHPLSDVQREAEGYMAIGTSPSVASGRIAYVLGLNGPAVTFDTACSSSLVAIHSAIAALRLGEVDMALAGGSSIQATPGMFVDFSRQRGLAPDGRCKSFSDDADGTSWAEGAGVLVLERLEDAQKAGRNIVGVLRGSAINQDGASNGLSAPSGRAQRDVIRRALTDADLLPDDVDMIEAHGTGTKLGDPIEANALIEVYAKERKNAPIGLGSLKSNIGHAMAAAGVGGLIKCLISMAHGRMPKSLHIGTPSTHVEWPDTMRLLTDSRHWPARDGVRRAAVSSFGISGTNAHVLVESYDAEIHQGLDSTTATSEMDSLLVLPFGAKSPSALKSLSSALSEFVAGEDNVSGFCRAYALGRESMPFRAVARGRSRTELTRSLDEATALGDVVDRCRTIDRPVLVFPGQGGQWDGMGRDLHRSNSVFRRTVNVCSAAFEAQGHSGVRSYFEECSDRQNIDDIGQLQPVLFTLMVGLAEVWESVGVRASAVVGHSQGEVAAAFVAGALDRNDAVRIVLARSRLLRRIAGHGGMVVVGAARDVTQAAVTHLGLPVSVASSNGPRTTTVAGVNEQDLQILLDYCDDNNIFARRLAVDCASHSSAVDGLENDLLEELAGIRPRDTTTRMYSTVTCGPVRGSELDGDYWFQNLRREVRFHATVVNLMEEGYDAFVEASPHPTTVQALQDTADDLGRNTIVLQSLRRDVDSLHAMVDSVSEAYVAGFNILWESLGTTQRSATLCNAPTYPFDGLPFWSRPREKPRRTLDRKVLRANVSQQFHPWLSNVVHSPRGNTVFTGSISVRVSPWLADHRVGGCIYVPGAAIVEILCTVGRILDLEAVNEVSIVNPLELLEDGSSSDLYIDVSPVDAGGSREFVLHAKLTDADQWTLISQGSLSALGATPSSNNPRPIRSDGEGTVDYEQLHANGYQYGPAFRGALKYRTVGDSVTSELSLPTSANVNSRGLAFHPVILDTALHTAISAALIEIADDEVLLPFSWTDVQSKDFNHSSAVITATVERMSGNAVTVQIRNEHRDLLVSVGRLEFRSVSARDTTSLPEPHLYRVDWRKLRTERVFDAVSPRALIVMSDDDRLNVMGRQPGTVVSSVKEAVAFIRSSVDTYRYVVLPIPDDLGREDAFETDHASSAAALASIQEWLALSADLDDVQLVVVTSNSMGPRGTAGFEVVSGGAWGIFRAAQAEWPNQIRLVDVDVDIPALTSFDWWAKALESNARQIAVRQGRLYAPVLSVIPTAGTDSAMSFDGTLLVTGAAGTLGALVVRHVVRCWGVRSVVLMGRRGMSSSFAQELVAELEAQNVRVAVIKGDVAREDDVRVAVDAAPAGRPIRGVIHAAGILDDAPVATMTPEQLDNVMRVKVQGAKNLAAVTQNHDLQLFVMFSSVYGHLGGPGQANYSAANVCIDSLADNLRSSGRQAVSIGWGLWGTATGMTSHLNSVDRRRLADSGVLEFDVEAGLRLLDRAVQGPDSVVIAARLNTLVTSIMPADEDRAAVTPHTAGGKQKGESVRLAPVELPECDIKALLPVERSRVAIEYIRSAVSALLDRPVSDIDFKMPFHQMGFDSLTTMELRNRLNKTLGVRLSATTIFNNPTLDELASHIIELVEEQQGPSVSQEDNQLEYSSNTSRERECTPSVIIDPSPLQEAYILGRGSEFELGEVSTYFYISVDIVGLDLRRFDAVLNSMVSKYDSLRTVVSHDGKLEILHSVPKFASSCTDLRGLGKVDQLREAESAASEIRNQVLDVRSWPLFDVRALELDGDVTRLHLGFDVLIVDGSSAAVLFSEISQMYNSSAGTVNAHPQLTYARYRALAADFWPSSEIDRARDYWMERIDALPLGPQLPVLKTGSNSARGRFSHRSKTFSKDRFRALKEHCMSAGFTPSVALCSAYALVIGRWSAEQQFALNVMSSSRLPVAEGVDSVVGNFSQTAILEVDVSDDLDFSLVCSRVQKQMWRDMEFAQFSGVEVIREINRRRGTIGRATFPVVFTSTLDSTATRDSSRSGMIAPLLTLGSRAEYVDSGLRTPQVWIDHQAVEEDGDLILNWDCVEDIFPSGVLDQMFSNYCRLVEMLMDDRHSWYEFKLSDLKLDDRELSKFIESRSSRSDSRLLHSGFLDCCSKRPDALAVICQGTVLTYSELNGCANNIAAELKHHRKQSGPLVVGIVMNKGWEQIAAVVAVLKCGATYVPIAPDAPPKRVDEILASSNVTVLLTQRKCGGTSWLTETEISSVVVDSSFIAPSVNEVISDAGEHDLAYIIYTSGSTGTPKGVEIEHAAVVNTIDDVNRRLELSESDRIFALSALQFDLSVWDIFGPLSVGGSVVVPRPDQLTDPQAWMEICTSGSVTIWNSVPALMDLFAEFSASASSPNSCPVSIRSVLLSGDWIPLTLPAAIRRVIPGVRIWSLGGATEISIWSIIHEVYDTDDSWRSIPYGTPLANQNAHVLDSSLRPCPDWVRGEIYFSGKGLARGYAGDIEKTERAFIIDQSTGLRLYKTGDYGLVRPGGVVEFLGRKDAQVKINGYRIELGEIESALLRCSGVTAAAVVVRENGVNKQLVGIVAIGSVVSDTDWILRELSSYVPNYMLPGRIHVVDQFPLTVNGKVDRDALQALASAETSTASVATESTETELRIMDVWRELLPDAEIDRNSKFFSVGGDSLAAIRLVGRLREIASWDVPAEAVFSNPTVADLGVILDSVSRST